MRKAAQKRACPPFLPGGAGEPLLTRAGVLDIEVLRRIVFALSIVEPHSTGDLVRTARVICCVLLVFGTLTCTTSFAQRVYFPSQVVPLDPVPGPVAPATPVATLAGTIQGPPATFDPYAMYNPGPTPLLAQGPNAQFIPPGLPTSPTFSFATMRRLFEELRLDYVWMPGKSANEFGVNDVELSTTVNLPFLYNEAPLQVTPGFAVHYWRGPVYTAPTFVDLPPRAYDAYLQGAWEPRITPWLSGDVAFRVGVYSDFSRVTEDELRYMGKGLIVLSFSPSVTIKAGAWYLDRNRVKILPAGGMIWTPGGPGGDARFEMLFPNPKLARRLTRVGDTDWWGYLRGEYGGGSWMVTHLDPADPTTTIRQSVDYNDIRVALGLEFFRPSGFTGLFEAGMAFDREIVYHSGTPNIFRPNNTVFVRGGMAF